MLRYLVLAMIGIALAGCMQSKHDATIGPEAKAVMNELANGPAPGMPPVVAGAAMGNPAGPRCFGTDPYGNRHITPC
jgi:hypothetical protein